jgi:D-alanyl-D-alanine carboxypeptidase
MKDNVIPGAIVLISSPDTGTWTGTFGTRTIGEDDPVTAADHFRVGSNTKTMTSTVILQLVQEGKLSLDDPIGTFISGVPNGDKITIADLSEMRSGLHSYSFDPTFNQTLDEQPQKAWTPQELLDIAFARPVKAQPGTTFDYSNTNIVLLGLVIEKLTGMTAAEAFQQRIFGPLGMKNTSLPAADDPRSPIRTRRVTRSAPTRPPSTPTRCRPPMSPKPLPARCCRTTRRTRTRRGPGRPAVPFPRTSTRWWAADCWTRRRRSFGWTACSPPTRATRPRQKYGLGIAQVGPLVGHDGQIPGYMTFMGHDPKTGLTVVILTNLATVPTGEGSALTILKSLPPILYQGVPLPSGDPAAAPGAASPGAGSSGPTSAGG